MFTTLAFLDLGAPELALILLIVLFLFGNRKLPELSRSVGQSLRELRSGIAGSEAAEKTVVPGAVNDDGKGNK